MDYFFYGGTPAFDLKPQRRAVSRLGMTFFLLCLISNAAAIFLSSLYIRLHPGVTTYPNWLEWTITILALYVIAAPLSLLCLRGVPATTPTRRRLAPRTFFTFALIGFSLMILGSIIGQSVNSVIERIVGITQGEDLTEAMEGSALWLTALYSLVIAPVMEELFFRKLLVDRLGYLGTWPCVLASGIAFGLFHGNIEQFFYAALLGCLFAFVYYNTGSLLVCVLMHSLVNLIGGILPSLVWAFTPDFTVLEGEALTQAITAYPFAYLLNLLVAWLPYVLALVGTFLLSRHARRLWSTATPTNLPRGTRASVFLGNPGTILYFVVSGISILISIIL